MNGSRRRVLAASSGLVALAGCLSSLTGESRHYAPESPGREPEDPTTNGEFPATVRATTTVARDDLDYVASNDSVRYVAGWRTNHSGETPTRKPIYETIPFEEWAETECAHVGAKRVMAAMRKRLDGSVDGISAGVTTIDGHKVVVVAHQTVRDRDGDVVSEPSASYERVKQVAPDRVAVNLALDQREYSCAVRVKTRREEIRQS